MVTFSGVSTAFVWTSQGTDLAYAQSFIIVLYEECHHNLQPHSPTTLTRSLVPCLKHPPRLMGRCVHWWLGFPSHHSYHLAGICRIVSLYHSGLAISYWTSFRGGPAPRTSVLLVSWPACFYVLIHCLQLSLTSIVVYQYTDCAAL